MKLQELRIKLMEFDEPTIYCDMDGVIADFQKFTSEHLGKKFKDDYWGELPDDMFFQLPKMPDADQLWNFIKKYDPLILTAHPRPGRGPISDRAASDKVKWMKKNFNWPSSKIYPVLRANKANFAKDGRDGRPNLLIDDHPKNVQEFRKRGGIGIIHTSAANTIKQLKEMGYK